MSAKPLKMMFMQHLLVCLMNGTSITESGLTVSTDKQPGETILFFRIDSDAGRGKLGMAGLRCCDCLVFYAKENKGGEQLCFLELKGAGVNEAIEQILSAHQKVKKLLDASRIEYVNVRLKACIVVHQAFPAEMRYIDKLKQVFGKENVLPKFGVKHYKEFGAFLRK